MMRASPAGLRCISKHRFFIDLHKGAGEIEAKRFILGGSRARRWWGYLSSKAGWYISETKSNFLAAALTLTVNFWIWSCSYQLGL
jgi:hypothetical protein